MSRRMRIIINSIFNSIFLYIYLHCSVYFSVILMLSLGSRTILDSDCLYLLQTINLYFKNILYNFEFDRFVFPETCTGWIVYDNTAVRFSRDVIFTDAGFQSMMTLLLTQPAHLLSGGNVSDRQNNLLLPPKYLQIALKFIQASVKILPVCTNHGYAML